MLRPVAAGAAGGGGGGGGAMAPAWAGAGVDEGGGPGSRRVATALRLMDGTRSLDELAGTLGVPEPELLALVAFANRTHRRGEEAAAAGPAVSVVFK